MRSEGRKIMVVLSSPSGAGKTTLTKKFNKNLIHSRSPCLIRQENREITRLMALTIISFMKKFKEMIERKEFYEYAKIYDNFYGTAKKTVDELNKINDIIFDIDWQGNQQLSKYKNLNLIKIYITITSKKDLRKRLLVRNQDSINEVEKRFKSFDEDIKHWKDYDYVVINENLENCFKQIEKIIVNHKTFSLSQINS